MLSALLMGLIGKSGTGFDGDLFDLRESIAMEHLIAAPWTFGIFQHVMPFLLVG
jgi:hypothetical protein